MGYFRGGASGDREAVLRLRVGALGQRRAGRGPHAPLPAGVAVVSVQVCAGGDSGAAAADQSAAIRVRGAIGAGDAAGEPQREGLDQDLGDVFGSGGGGIYVYSQTQVERVCGVVVGRG